jgi:hypothetical protein
MRIVQVAGFMAAIMVALAASARPSAAVVIYPWCANYAGKWGASSCGSVSLKQCLATLAGNGGTCDPNPFYSRIHHRRRIHHLSGGDAVLTVCSSGRLTGIPALKFPA